MPVMIPCVAEEERNYRFHRYLGGPGDPWFNRPVKLRRGQTYQYEFVLNRPASRIDNIEMLLETPESMFFKAWVRLNGHLVARLGEYGGLDLVGDHPEYLKEGLNLLELKPEWIGGLLRSIMLYEIDL